MILHLFDDEKVVNRAIESFEKALPDRNIYICFANDSIKFVQMRPNLHFVKDNDVCDEVDYTKVSAIIIHLLTYKKVLFINKYINRKIPIYWIMWGADYYNELLHSHGLDIYYEPHYLGYKFYIKKLLSKLGYRTKSLRIIETFIKERITHCLSSNFEFDICLKYCYSLFCDKNNVSMFFYYPISLVLNPNLLNNFVDGHKILLGNSASFTNNHNYAFKYLKDIDLRDKTIVTPLSYGGNKKYINHVISQGRRLFPEHYEPLLKFLPLDEYNRLMLEAEVCIFSSWRQEANGNVVIALYLGAKVFMSNRSPLYKRYKDMGIVLFELESITEEQLNTPLSIEDRQNNRTILLNRFSAERQIEVIKNIWGDF